jgi:hypothetical protein
MEEIARYVPPMKAVIRCKAKQQLLTDSAVGAMVAPLDEELFKEVAATFFRSNQYQELLQQHHSKSILETELAAELVDAYRRIKLQQQHPMIQRLNALL